MRLTPDYTAMIRPDDHPKCFCCGDPPTAEWHGLESNVAVCQSCALDVLPRLLADATVSPKYRDVIGAATRDLEQASSRFWFAVACAVAYAARPPIVPLEDRVLARMERDDRATG